MTTPTHPRRAESACAVPDAVERVSDLRATHDVDCDTAAGVAAAYDQRVMEGQASPEAQPMSAAGFQCVTQPAGPPHEETFQVHCQRGLQGVSLLWGV